MLRKCVKSANYRRISGVGKRLTFDQRMGFRPMHATGDAGPNTKNMAKPEAHGNNPLPPPSLAAGATAVVAAAQGEH